MDGLAEALVWMAAVVLLLIRYRIYWRGGHCHVRTDLTGKVAVITGAAQGIGRATMQSLLESGCRVVFGDCDRVRSEMALAELLPIYPDKLHYFPLDLADRNSVKQFAQAVLKLHQIVDILVNNAGVMAMRRRTLTPDGVEKQLAINYLGHLLLTKLLLKSLLLSDRPRICNLASMAYSHVVHSGVEVSLDLTNLDWSKPEVSYNDDIAYSRSKLAIVLTTSHMAELLREKCPHLRMVSLHPGAVRTQLPLSHHLACGIFYVPFMLGYPFYWFMTKSVTEGAQTTLFAIHESNDKLQSGGYYSDCQQQPIISKSNTQEIRDKLWEWSCCQLGLAKELAV